MTTAVADIVDIAARALARRPLELAALGVAALPTMQPVSVIATRPTRDGVDTAVVRDASSTDWVVAAPRPGAAGAELEAELAVLTLLGDRMPFAVPHPSGQARLPGGGRAVVYPALGGSPVHLPDLGTDSHLAESVGRAMAALHVLDPEEFVAVGVPQYDGQELRRRCMVTLDRAAETGLVPGRLLGRWESRIENVGRWRFSPCPVHGELLADRVLVNGSAVAAVVDWSGTRVSDPAEDLAWLAVGADPEAFERILAAYRAARGGALDPDVVERAVLHGEMALAVWLLHGLRTGDGPVVEDASSMLAQLAVWHEAHDGVPAHGTSATGRPAAASEPDEPDPAAVSATVTPDATPEPTSDETSDETPEPTSDETPDETPDEADVEAAVEAAVEAPDPASDEPPTAGALVVDLREDAEPDPFPVREPAPREGAAATSSS